MSFKPLSCPGRWYGVLAILAIAALDAFIVRQLLTHSVNGLSFVLALWVLASLAIAAYVGYRTFGAFTLEYWVDRDAVTLVWGSTRQIVPITRIQRVLRASGSQPLHGARPWHWPCPHRRRMRVADLGIVNGYGTSPLAEQVVLVTDDEAYGLSPADPQGFVDALQQRAALGAARLLEPELLRPPLWTWTLWRDRAALFLVLAGMLGVLVMFGVLCFRFPALSSDLPLHFDATGLPDRIAPKSELFVLPLIGLVAWSINAIAGVWLYRRVQQGTAYLLWGGALVVQGIAGLALFNLMRW